MGKVRFDEEAHRYWIKEPAGTEKELISVTTLLKRHGLSPDYSEVPAEVLTKKAQRGKVVHSELDSFVKHGEVGFTEECLAFKNFCEKNKITKMKSEVLVHNDLVAGTFDVMGKWNNENFLADFKTTKVLHKESVAWQLSIYEYLSGIQFKYLYALHFHDGLLEVVNLERIPKEELLKLFDAERNCELYQKQTLELTTLEQQEVMALQDEMRRLKNQMEVLEVKERQLKDYLFERMQNANIKSFENEYFKITRIDEQQRDTLDTAKLKAEMPEVINQYIKTTIIKPTVRITLKE